MSFIAKLSRVMKLTALILTVCAVHVMARTSGQTISYRAENVPLKQVFAEIEKQTGYLVVYNSAKVGTSKPVTINAKDEPLEKFLNTVLGSQGLQYMIAKKTILISPKEEVKKNAQGSLTPDLTPGLLPPPPNPDVTITVLNTDNQPLEGASIIIKGQNKGIATDINGRATLRGVDPNATVIISFTGYVNQEVKLSNRGINPSATSGSVVIRLTASTSELDEMQVIAYGKVSKRFNVGNVTTVKGEEIQRQPVGNVLQALEGKVPGLFVTQANGIAGGGVTVRVQGQNSINNGNDPLYVVDGMPISSQDLISLGNVLGTSGGTQYGPVSGFGSALSYINPSDIESVEVLKDAAATAIYGSRAANGAILITTKKGKAGKTKIDINVQQGWGKVTRKLDMLNTQQYLGMRHEAKMNDNAAVSATDYDINGVWDTTRYTDWQKTLIGGTSQYSNINANISGGNASVQYLVGGTWHRETSVFPGSFEDQKGSLHLSLNASSDNQKFKLQFTTSYMTDNNLLPSVDLTSSALLTEPDAPALFLPDGSLNWALNSSGNSTWNNPLRYLYVPFKNKVSNLVSGALLSYQILPGLELKSNFGYKKTSTYNFLASTVMAATKPETRSTAIRKAVYAYGTDESWNIEPQLSYIRKIGNGIFDALIGSTILQNNLDNTTLSGSGYTSDALMESPVAATTLIASGSTKTLQYKYAALYGKLNYNLENRYIVDLTARRDGSSRFGPESQFHNFGAAGAAWIFSQEQLFQRALRFLSFGKLKASYGSSGSDQIADYAYLNSYYPIAGLSNVAYQGISSIAPGGLTNPAIAWEETSKLQIGIDIGFLNDRLLIGASYSRNRSSNQLLGYNLPSITGFRSINQNLPATVQNTSWELSLNTVNIKSKSIRWTSSINFTIPNNKLVDYPGLASSSYANNYIIGKPLNLNGLFHFLGVDPSTGKYLFADINGNATSSPKSTTLLNGDRTVIITTFPKFYGGFQNSLTYKGFQLDFAFQFTKQLGPNLIYFTQIITPGQFFNGTSNQPVSILRHWQKPGDISSVQRFSAGATAGISQISNSDAYYVDASYLRLKNLSLSYELPGIWKQKAHLQGCRIYLQGQNVLTITNYKGLDPENQGNSSLPPLKVLTLGLQIGF
ncbi:MAG: SusC/RagA family TonB-linked outer membrane protein [Bacteroidota bacterium]